jgi:hypothetical protein
MFAGCLQIMWAHLHLIRVEGGRYLQIIRAEKADVCRVLRFMFAGRYTYSPLMVSALHLIFFE